MYVAQQVTKYDRAHINLYCRILYVKLAQYAK